MVVCLSDLNRVYPTPARLCDLKPVFSERMEENNCPFTAFRGTTFFHRGLFCRRPLRKNLLYKFWCLSAKATSTRSRQTAFSQSHYAPLIT